jgi:SOS-response transcriptional repressor LexA
MEVSENTIYRWEAGLNSPSDNDKYRLAKILEVSVSFLMGESEELTRVSKPKAKTYVDWVEVPVLDPSAIACAGFGNGGMDGIVAEAEQCIALPQDWLGPIGEHKPFIISVEGDSMEEANIPAGSKIAINPEAEIYNGDPALVCFGIRNEWAVKWVYWQRDGGLELRSASPNYPPRYFTKEDIDNGWCRIIGKVMRSVLTPKKGM